MGAFDTDGDGMLSYDEGWAMYSSFDPEANQDDFTEDFKNADADNNGMVD